MIHPHTAHPQQFRGDAGEPFGKAELADDRVLLPDVHHLEKRFLIRVPLAHRLVHLVEPLDGLRNSGAIAIDRGRRKDLFQLHEAVIAEVGWICVLR